MSLSEKVQRLADAHQGKGYDYSGAVYVNAATKIGVKCPEHGVFWQLPSNHIKGSGCPHCAKRERLKGTFKQQCKELQIDYWRALKRREAGMPEEKILAEGYVRSQKVTNTAITVSGVFYPSIRAACLVLRPPGNETTIERWVRKGMAPEEAFRRVPNPGYRNGVIYCVTHKDSGKRYVGLTVQTLARRWQDHQEQAAAGNIQGEHSLHAAIRQCSADAFSVEQIDAGRTKVDLEAKERLWIDRMGTLAPAGFNLDSGGVSGGSNAKPVVVDGVQFRSVGEAALAIAEMKGISLDAAKRRLRKGRLHVKKLAKPGESMVQTKVYKAWSFIVHGATNPKSRDYIAGVALHEPWRTFEVFLADVGQPTGPGLSFARRDKTMGFIPGNCCWMTKSDASKINAAHMKAEGRLTGRRRREG